MLEIKMRKHNLWKQTESSSTEVIYNSINIEEEIEMLEGIRFVRLWISVVHFIEPFSKNFF